MSSVATNTQVSNAGFFLRFSVKLFLVSLLIPLFVPIGGVLLMPHRAVLLVLTLPLMALLFMGRAGKVGLIDWLMLFCPFWACMSLIANRVAGSPIEPAGIIFLEFYGAFLLGRVAIRTSEDFRSFVRMFFLLILFLVPFAAMEAITHRPILLQIVPSSISIDPSPPRWGMRRAQTLFAHPILYGVFVSMGLGVFWYVLKSGFWRLFSVPLVALGTLFSLSTGALMSVFFQVIFLGWELITRPSRNRWRVFAGLSAFAYVTLDMLSNRNPFHLVVDYATFNSGSAYNRILIWRFGTQNVRDNPIFGLGLRDWVRPHYMSGSADNFWLLMTMQYGLPFFVAFALAMFFIVRRTSRQPLSDPLDRASRAGYLVTLGGVVMAGATVHYWTAMMAFVMFFFGSGMWIICGGARSRVEDTVADPSPVERKPRYSRRPVHATPGRRQAGVLSKAREESGDGQNSRSAEAAPQRYARSNSSTRLRGSSAAE
ncbi:MAG: O-antigen ligase family protein [Arenibacterium sp.]